MPMYIHVCVCVCTCVSSSSSSISISSSSSSSICSTECIIHLLSHYRGTNAVKCPGCQQPIQPSEVSDWIGLN